MQKRKVASLAFTGVAGVGMAAWGTAPALAAGGTWTVNHTGTVKATATQTTLGAGVTLTCKTATATGKITNATGADSKPVASITAASFKSCTGFGATINAKLTKTAFLFATSPTTSKGFTKGFIGGPTGKAPGAISAALTGSTFGAHCTAKVIGSSVPGSYSNTSHKLLIDTGHVKTLTIKSPHSCTGIANNSPAYFSAHYTVTSPAGLTVNNT